MSKKDSNGFTNYNGDTVVDVQCGRLIPQGNLNVNQPGSYAYMKKSLDDAYKSHNVYTSVASGGFIPGYTTKGLEGAWGTMTCTK